MAISQSWSVSIVSFLVCKIKPEKEVIKYMQVSREILACLYDHMKTDLVAAV